MLPQHTPVPTVSANTHPRTNLQLNRNGSELELSGDYVKTG